CNYLISQGAGVAISLEDVLDRLHQISGSPGGSGPGSAAGPSHGTSKSPGHETAESTGFEDNPGNDADELDNVPIPEPTIEDDILSIIDIIPVSTSYIMEELYKKGRDTSIPVLMTTLMDMTGSGLIAQNGAYYRRIS
ncbi:MAG: hypothetical protein K6G10_02095, partial [Butyrivibrio sp.]|nr:hypothetical protein [Butyrivibrio sp.]